MRIPFSHVMNQLELFFCMLIRMTFRFIKEIPQRISLNLPGIFGLHAALRWLEENFEKVHEHEKALSARMLDGLKDVEEIHLAGLFTVEGRVSVISIDL